MAEKKGYALDQIWWDRLQTLWKWKNGWRVTGAFFQNTDNGATLSIGDKASASPPQLGTSEWIQITSAKAKSGVYGAKRCTYKDGYEADPDDATPEDPDADTFDVPDEEDCLFFNIPERFLDPVSHFINADGTVYFYARASREPNVDGLFSFTDNYAKSVKDIRLNEAETWVQATYVTQASADADWVDKIQVGDCDEGA